MIRGWSFCCVVLGIAAGCSPSEPTAPDRFSITGHVRLSGSVVDTSGAFVGTRVLGDPDGVTVELLNGGVVVARTVTVDGVYRFSGLRPGGYVARSTVVGDIGDQTRNLVIAVADVASADTLRLGSRGDLRPVPNPFTDTLAVYFTVSDTVWLDLDVLDVGGRQVRSLLSVEVLPNDHRVRWYGQDQAGRPAPGSLFWVTYAAGTDFRAQLVFR